MITNYKRSNAKLQYSWRGVTVLDLFYYSLSREFEVSEEELLESNTPPRECGKSRVDDM